MMAFNIILSNKTIGRKAALQKILVGVFGVNKLSQSCEEGKKCPEQISRSRLITGNNIFTNNYYIIHVIFPIPEIWGKLC